MGSAFGNPSGSLANYVNGQNNRGNSFQLDGTINNETNVISQSAIVPPPEAIQVMDVRPTPMTPRATRHRPLVERADQERTNQLHGAAWATTSTAR